MATTTTPAVSTEDCPCRLAHSDSHDPIADCTECEGTGTIDVDSLDERAAELEQYEHWHDQLGADQFCMACDQEAA